MRIDINLASQPYQDSRRFWIYWGTGLALLALLTALLVFVAATGYVRAGRDRQEIAKLQAEIASYDQERNQAQALLAEPQNRTMREQSQYLNSLFEQKSFSWTRVFEDLEQVMPAHLRVLSIHPDLASGNNLKLKLTVGGDSREQALDLVRKMEDSNHLKQTQIDSERTNENNAGAMNSGGDRVQFEIEAQYIPTTNSENTTGGMH